MAQDQFLLLRFKKEGGNDFVWTCVFILSLPFLVLISPFFLLKWFFGLFKNDGPPPDVSTQTLIDQALKPAEGMEDMTATAFWTSILTKLVKLPAVPKIGITTALMNATEELYVWDGFDIGEVRTPPTDPIELGRYRDLLKELASKKRDFAALEVARDTLVKSYTAFTDHLPAVAKDAPQNVLAEAQGGTKNATTFTTPLLSLVKDTGRCVQDMVLPFFGEEQKDKQVFKKLRDQLAENQHAVSEVPRSKADSPKLIMPADLDAPPKDIVYHYLRHTPLEAVFYEQLPFALPERTRFEHHWIVAGSGHGKTQTLQYMIANDLDKVTRREASVVVIDSQGDLIKNVSGLKLFARGEPLQDRLCVIDPTDLEYPVALNLFDVGLQRLQSYSELDREKLQNAAIELYEFILGALLGAEMTSKQSTLFRYVLRLMLQIPGATIHTFRELMSDGVSKYGEALARLHPTARTFFETEFEGNEFRRTRSEVTRRIWAILENQTFERMFSHPRNKLDLFSEMNAGKVILINTAKDLLKQNGTEIFGRFFIALLAQAAQERAVLHGSNRLPTFVYIDEAQDYFDENISLILEQARKFNVGMILAHQYIGQLSGSLQESVAANTSIKFAGGVSAQDARVFARHLRCDADFIEKQPKGHFAAFIRNETDTALSLRVPFGYLEAKDRLSYAEKDALRDDMRRKYAVHYSELTRPTAPPPRLIDPSTLTDEPVKW